MTWIALLGLMLMIAAAPGVSIYLEHLRSAGTVESVESEPPVRGAS